MVITATALRIRAFYCHVAIWPAHVEDQSRDARVFEKNPMATAEGDRYGTRDLWKAARQARTRVGEWNTRTSTTVE